MKVVRERAELTTCTRRETQTS